MKTKQTINFQNYTRLPVRELVKAGGTAVAIEVQTPTGKVTLDYHYVSVPFLFGSANSVEHPASKIISKLRQLEQDAVEHLLDNWKKTLQE